MNTDTKFIEKMNLVLTKYDLSNKEIATLAEAVDNAVTAGSVIYDEDTSRKKVKRIIRSGIDNRVKLIN